MWPLTISLFGPIERIVGDPEGHGHRAGALFTVARKSRKPPKPDPETIVSVLAKVVLAADDSTLTEYVNYAQISHSQHEFGIMYARVPTKLSEEQLAEIHGGVTLSMGASVQLLIPPTMLPGLIRALENQKLHSRKHLDQSDRSSRKNE